MLVTDTAQTARGAILIFLLIQLTHNDSSGKIGVSNPFSHYTKVLPAEILLPTFWNDSEKLLLEGTSLQAALESKLGSLDRELSDLRTSTASIAWCNERWWDNNPGNLTIGDWMYIDAAYRSRALELPNTGHAVVPCIDMANHASGPDTGALYETDPAEGDAVLLLRPGREITSGQELTITYGDEKGACEMLFSYGFIEDGLSDAREIFLSIEIPEDDPLGLAKRAASKSPPGFKLFRQGSTIAWEGPLVWLICINEEDGLEFQLAQQNDGSRVLFMSFQGTVLEDASSIQKILEAEAIWEVFQLRATTTVQSSVEQQLVRLHNSQDGVQAIQEGGDIRSTVEGYAMELRILEEAFLLEAYEALEHAKIALFDSAVVQNYLNGPSGIPNTTTADANNGSNPVAEDDFS